MFILFAIFILIIYETFSYLTPIIQLSFQPMILRQSQFNIITKMQATKQYIVQLTDTNQLNVINNPKFTNNIFIQQLHSSIQTSPISDFSINQKQGQLLASFFKPSFFSVVYINNGTKLISQTLPSSQQGAKIKLIRNNIAILTKNKTIIFYILDFNQNSPFKTWSIDYNFDVNTMNFTFCQDQNKSSYSFTVWDSYGRLLFGKFVLNRTAGTGEWIVSMKRQALQNSISNWNLYIINFDKTCNYAIYLNYTSNNIRIFNYEQQRFYDTMIRPTQIVYRVQFYGGKANQFIVYYQNNSLVFYQFFQKQAMYKGKIQSDHGLSMFSLYLQQYQHLIISKHQKIYSNITKCQTPSVFNSQFYCSISSDNAPQNCSQCTFSNYQCNITSNTCIQTQIQTFPTQQIPQKPKTIAKFILDLIGLQENFYSTFIYKNQQIIKGALFTPFVLAQSLPLASFLIGFLNYWSICSLYALVQISKPQVLKKILDLIYQAVNYSTFNLLQINTEVSSGLQNHFEGLYLQEYGISSVFIQEHMQDFLKFFISIIIIIIMYYTKKSIQKDTWLYGKLNLNYKLMALSQYVSFMTGFFLPSKIIPNFFTSNSIYEKFNLILHILFIGVSLILPFTIKSMTKIVVKKSAVFTKITYKIKYQKDYTQLYYCSLCSSVFPFVIIGGKIILIFLIGLYVFIKGLNYAGLQTQFRINKVILNLHPLLFHISFTLMYLFSQYIQTSKIFGFFCIVFLIIGGVHEVANLIFEILYPLIQKYRPRTNVKDQNQIKKNYFNFVGLQIKKIFQFLKIKKKKNSPNNNNQKQSNIIQKLSNNRHAKRQNNSKFLQQNELYVNYQQSYIINKKKQPNQIQLYQTEDLSSHYNQKHDNYKYNDKKLGNQTKRISKFDKISQNGINKDKIQHQVFRKKQSNFAILDRVNKKSILKTEIMEFEDTKKPIQLKIRKIQGNQSKMIKIQLNQQNKHNIADQNISQQ